MALGTLRALRELGLRVAEDVSLVGFDGLFLTEVITPALTTVVQDERAIGYEAAAMLHALMEHRGAGGHKLVPYSLAIRESVRRKP